MHRRAGSRHFLIVFALAHVLAIHGLLAAWGGATSVHAGRLDASAVFCISGQGQLSPESGSPAGQRPHHDCAMACAAIAGPAPVSASGILTVPAFGTGAVMVALGNEAQTPNRFSGAVQARGPPRAA
jgi:hypothetical protein